MTQSFYNLNWLKNWGEGHPQYNLTGLNLGLDYWISDLFFAGVSFGSYSSSPTVLQKTLNDNFSDTGMSFGYTSPQDTFYGRIGCSPIHGLVNLFGSHVISSDLVTGLGVGGTRMSNHTMQFGLLTFIEERLLIYKHLGISLGYAYYLEQINRDFTAQWLGRGQIQAGVYVKL